MGWNQKCKNFIYLSTFTVALKFEFKINKCNWKHSWYFHILNRFVIFPLQESVWRLVREFNFLWKRVFYNKRNTEIKILQMVRIYNDCHKIFNLTELRNCAFAPGSDRHGVGDPCSTDVRWHDFRELNNEIMAQSRNSPIPSLVNCHH